MTSSVIIAVDGPVAAGKGTLAKKIASHYGYAYLDTGTLYRAVGLRVLRAGGDPTDMATAASAAEALQAQDLIDPRLRDQTVSEAASKVGMIPAVREALLDFQRNFAHRPPKSAPGAVLDGRDIGTVVCPDATVKIFVTARPEVRVKRRFQEVQSRGGAETLTEVKAEVEARDARDADRNLAPLKPADDAHLLDTSDLAIDGAFAAALAIIEANIRR